MFLFCITIFLCTVSLLEASHEETKFSDFWSDKSFETDLMTSAPASTSVDVETLSWNPSIVTVSDLAEQNQVQLQKLVTHLNGNNQPEKELERLFCEVSFSRKLFLKDLSLEPYESYLNSFNLPIQKKLFSAVFKEVLNRSPVWKIEKNYKVQHVEIPVELTTFFKNKNAGDKKIPLFLLYLLGRRKTEQGSNNLLDGDYMDRQSVPCAVLLEHVKHVILQLDLQRFESDFKKALSAFIQKIEQKAAPF